MPWEKSSWPLLKNGGKAFKNCFKESEIVVKAKVSNLYPLPRYPSSSSLTELAG